MVRGALQQYGLVFEVPGLVGAYRAEYNAWLKDRTRSLDQDALTYAVVHMNQTGVVWEEARRAKYPRNLVLFRSLAASDNTDIIDKLLQGNLNDDVILMSRNDDELMSHHQAISN